MAVDNVINYAKLPHLGELEGYLSTHLTVEFGESGASTLSSEWFLAYRNLREIGIYIL